MSDPRTTIDLERLRTLLDAYGGSPRAWPDAERDAALALLARSAAARRLQADALALDAVLDAALDVLPAAEPRVALEERIVSAALAERRVAAAGDARAETQRAAGDVRAIDTARAARTRAARRRLGLLAGAVPLAAAAALALWLRTEHTPPAQDVASAPVPEIALAALGVYETPGDALLDVPAVDGVYEAGTWAGCPDAWLGCVELETLPLEPVSLGHEERSFS